jgi:predicted amidohydrolase YtcJ
MDTHMAVVNTAVLKAVGLTTPTGTVAAAGDVVHAAAAAAASEGLIVRDPNTGLPTGMLR